MNFAGVANIARLTKEDRGLPTGFMAEIRIKCSDCGKPFQFLGLEPGIDLQGARISIDATEANLAICPQFEQPSPLDRIAVNLGPLGRRTN